MSTLVLCTLVAASCSDAGPLPPSPAPARSPEAPAGVDLAAAAPRGAEAAPDTPTDRSAPFDLGAIMRQVHFAFRPAREASTWSGGHTTYLTTVSEERLVVTPAAARDGARGQGLGLPITFETTSLGRGAPAPPRHDGARVESDGHLALARGSAVEHLRNTEEGVAQSFRFDGEPAGTGDLEVRVRVTGAEHLGESPEGHHFRAPDGEADIHYGKATWIDANGRTTPIEVRHLGGGELALIVPHALLDASAYPAEIDPVISVLLDLNQPILGFARLDQDKPAVAFDGTSYLVIWNDSRAIDEVYNKVYGARVTPAGQLLDPGGLEIFSTGSSGRPCAVAFDGANYFVVLADVNGIIRGTRVTPAGQVLDGGYGKTLGFTNNSVQEVSVAYGNGSYLVVWPTDTQYPANIKGQLVDTTATLMGAPFTIAGTQSIAEVKPRVASDGTDYFVVWYKAGDVFGARVSAAGAVLDPAGILLAGGAGDESPESIAFDGVNYLAVWVNSSPGSVVGGRVSPNGTLLDPSGIVIASGAMAGPKPHVAFDGGDFVVVWEHGAAGTDLYSNRITGGGALLDGPGIPLVTAAGAQRKPWVACGGAECLVAWEDDRGSGLDVFASRIQGGAALDGSGIHLSNAGSEQQMPSVTFGNGVYFAAWEDRRAGKQWDIYGTRIDTSGSSLDPAGIAISEAIGDQLSPRVAASNGGFLVTWEDDRKAQPGNPDYSEIYAARVTSAGLALDPAGIPITSDQNEDQLPAVASDGTSYLIAWRDTSSFANDKILATRVDAAGTSLDVPPITLVSAGQYENPAVAFGGGQYLVVWDGRAARVSTAGAVLDPAPGIATNIGAMQSVAFNGQGFLIAGRRYSAALQAYQMWGGRVSAAGTVLDPAGILLSSGGIPGYAGAWYRQGPEVTFDGVDSIILWPSGLKTAQATWLSPAGQVLFTSTLVSSNSAAVVSPTIASEGDGHHSLLAYAFGDPTPGVKHYRIKGNIVTAKTAGASCFAHQECKSLACVEGICCNTACDSGANPCKVCSLAAGAVADGTCTALTGTACTDGNACTQSDVCAAGTCAPGPAVTCQALDDCHVPGACQPATGQCSNPSKPNGAPCDDGDACTQLDLCQAGSCAGASPLSCAPPDMCHEPGTCEPATGSCTYVPKPNDAPCEEGNACTLGDTCQDGTCAAGAPAVCAPAGACQEAGVCDPATGQCAYASKANGTPCDDGNPCTQTDACKAGACAGANPVACPAPDDCTKVGVCDPATGQCLFSPKQDGAACDDGDACTEGDTCQMGSCSSGAPKACPAPPACHEMGSCDPAGGACSFAAQADGTGCDDGDACTKTDACVSGLCNGGDPVKCEALDECHQAGSCNAGTGQCSNPKEPNGTPCSLGECKNGVCTDAGTGAGGQGGGSGGSGIGGIGGVGQGGESGAPTGGTSPGGASSSGGQGSGTDGGCGCRVAAQDRPYGGAVLALAIGFLGMRRRRGAMRRTRQWQSGLVRRP